MESREIKVGAKYKHFKGNEYLVLQVAKHSETLEEYVVYQKVTIKIRNTIHVLC